MAIYNSSLPIEGRIWGIGHQLQQHYVILSFI